METNADPILITVGGMKNLYYRGWGGGAFSEYQWSPTRISKKGVITQKDYRGWIPVVYCNLHFKKSNMREVRRALWWIQMSISAIALKKNRSLVLNGHETFFLLRKRIYRSKSQAIICKSRPYDSFTAFLHHNITLNSHPWLLVWYSEPLSGCL